MNSELAKLKTSELIDLALAKAKSKPWDYDYITILLFRGTEDVLLAAQALCLSSEIAARKLGVDILGQLGVPKRTFPDECLHTLLDLLATETNERVFYSIGVALGQLNDYRAVEPVVKLKNHPDATVRYGVVSGILGHELPLAIETLIELSGDRDSDLVRGHATFALGVEIDCDTEAIREALLRRLREDNTDNNYHIYGKALAGLAKRKDERIIPILLEELRGERIDDPEGYLVIGAAAEIGDVRLYSALIALEKRWDINDYLLDGAIASCKPFE